MKYVYKKLKLNTLLINLILLLAIFSTQVNGEIPGRIEKMSGNESNLETIFVQVFEKTLEDNILIETANVSSSGEIVFKNLDICNYNKKIHIFKIGHEKYSHVEYEYKLIAIGDSICENKEGVTEMIFIIQDSIVKFYRLSHFWINFITSIILFIIWLFYFRKVKLESESTDYGLLFIAFGLLLWGVLSAFNFYEYHGLDFVFSPLNNGAFLMAIPFFKHGFKWVQKHTVLWYLLTITISITVLILICSFYSTNIPKYGRWVDFGFSTVTLILLLFSLKYSFEEREWTGLAYLSSIIFVIALFAQYSLISGADDIFHNYHKVAFAITHSIMASIFVALGFSWVNEKTNDYSPINIHNINDKIDKSKITEKYYNELIDNLSKNKTEEVIKEFLAIANNYDEKKDLHNILILKSAAINQINLQENKGTITDKDYRAERNKINNSLIKLLNQEKEELINNKSDKELIKK